jgi:hypothetical protein
MATIAGCRPTVASQHLSKLCLAGLVVGTRDGRRISLPWLVPPVVIAIGVAVVLTSDLLSS